MKKDWFRPRDWKVGQQRRIEIGPKAIIMGVLNVTPDSFSDGGDYVSVEQALARAEEMVEQGAHIIDVGGESSRPGAQPVDPEIEQSRVVPIIMALAAKSDALISVDTYRASTAKASIDAGAHIINDIWAGTADPAMAATVADAHCGFVAMHNSRDRECAADPLEDQQRFLTSKVEPTREGVSISRERSLWDPGIGFGKDAAENLVLLNRLDKLHDLNFDLDPFIGLLVGTSRKRFLGSITGRDAKDRAVATAATSVVARMKGAAVFRVHDIAANRDALAVTDALIHSHFGWPQEV